MIVIGDVHGCFDTLLKLMEQFPKEEPICFAGDLIDRGPKSAQVVQFVIDGKYDCVKGNHEQMMISPNSWDLYGDWAVYNGGRNTLESYKEDRELFQKHSEWMKSLPVFKEYEIYNTEGRKLVVSHSSVSCVWNWSAEMQEENKELFENEIMWNRNIEDDIPEIYNIFGHTPQKNGPSILKHYANIDTGCCFKGRSEYGKLTAVSFPSMKVYTQENCD